MANSTYSNWYQDLPGGGRRIAQVLALMLLAGLAASAGAFAYSYIISGRTGAKTAVSSRQITVTGEGRVAVRPDTAVFTAGVITQAKKISDAQAQNSSRANAIIDFLKTRGIADKDIKTIGYALSPQYQYFNSPPCTVFPCPPQRPPEIVGYEIRNTIEVKVRDLARADVFIEGATNAGANEVGSIAFRVDDEDAAKATARAEAIADARVKASRIAQALAVRLGRITGYYDQTDAPPPMYESANIAGMPLKAASIAPPIQPGEQEIRASVGIIYDFR